MQTKENQTLSLFLPNIPTKKINKKIFTNMKAMGMDLYLGQDRDPFLLSWLGLYDISFPILGCYFFGFLMKNGCQ